MSSKDSLTVEFSKKPPPIAELARFFQDVGWISDKKFIKKALPVKPHPLLVTIWIRLLHQGMPIGMARLYLPPPNQVNAPAFIGDVIIYSKYQGQGYGRQLISLIEKYCRRNVVNTLVIEPNPNSLLFWKSIGFFAKSSSENLLFKSIF